MTDDTPVLYLLARSDLDSMNAGKLSAQCGHAVSHFIINNKDKQLFEEWAGNRGFGTKITLDVGSEGSIIAITDFTSELGYEAGYILDPTYPILDGKIIHTLPLITCGYVFGRKKELESVLSHYNLYR